MDTVDLKLAQDCETLAVAASEGVAWLKGAAGESPTVAQQAPSLISELQLAALVSVSPAPWWKAKSKHPIYPGW